MLRKNNTLDRKFNEFYPRPLDSEFADRAGFGQHILTLLVYTLHLNLVGFAPTTNQCVNFCVKELFFGLPRNPCHFSLVGVSFSVGIFTHTENSAFLVKNGCSNFVLSSHTLSIQQSKQC